MLLVYLEQDMINVLPSQDHPKLKALKELLDHLMNRVGNSNAKVMPPVVEILQILASAQFQDFDNQAIQRLIVDHIFSFVDAAVTSGNFPKEKEVAFYSALI